MWNAQGVVDLGLFGDGGAATCDPTGATQRCTRKVLWLYALTAYWRSVNDQLSWQGTLLEDKQDGSGMVYRRARYLDPATGRFTQEDPIGLAGGLNTYGFASGDPVNFSDPLGLCPIPADDCPPGYFTALGTAVGAIIGGVGGGTGGFFGGAGVGAIPAGVLGAAKGAALGGAAGALIDGIVYASKQARAVGKAESLVGHIEDHLSDRANEPDSPAANVWRREIRAGIDNVTRQLKDMKGQTLEKWRKIVDEWSKRLKELTPQ
jgi:RHS repeat-associated protein